MAIKANSSEEQVAGAGGKLYTGIAAMKVLAVNPNLVTLQGMGVMYQKEPNYVVDFNKGDGPVQKIVFWLGNDVVKVPCEFLVNVGPWKSSTGKVKWYNRTGDNTWAPMLADGTIDTSNLPDWYKNPETSYVMPRGMDAVTEFVRAWANVATGDEIFLDTVEAITKGNVSELRSLVSVLSGNSVNVLVYVRDGKYQAVYTRHFGRIKPLRTDLFIKALNEDYGAIKGDYTLEWTEYTGSATAPDAKPKVSTATATTAAGDWDDETDDLPF